MTNGQKLNKYLSALPHGEYKNKIRSLSKFMGVSEKVVYNWQKGYTYITLPKRKKIIEFFKEDIFK